MAGTPAAGRGVGVCHVVYMYYFKIICLNHIMAFTCSLIMKSMISYVTLLSSDFLII